LTRWRADAGAETSSTIRVEEFTGIRGVINDENFPGHVRPPLLVRQIYAPGVLPPFGRYLL
jgi:hypothetical protein